MKLNVFVRYASALNEKLILVLVMKKLRKLEIRSDGMKYASMTKNI